MKLFQKLILPLLVLVVIIILYMVYFAPKGLGSFSDFDTNSNVNLDVTVQITNDGQIQVNQDQGTSNFYAVDKNGRVVLVSAPANLPPGIQPGSNIVLHGHLHKDHFHATEVKLK